MMKMPHGLSALALASLLLAGSLPAETIVEDFNTDPRGRGWKVFGDTNLFRWNAAQGHLEVTWDSSKPNSYFYLPLGTILSTNDDFALEFDLRMMDLANGTTPGKPLPFQFAVNLMNIGDATQPGFLRGTGYTSPNLLEFAYFPAFNPGEPGGWDASVTPVMVSRSGDWINSGWTFPLPMYTNRQYRIRMAFANSTNSLTTTILEDGTNNLPVLPARISANAFADFRLNVFAIPSYNDAGQYPGWEGSILAHGIVDNVVLTLPTKPVRNLASARVGQEWRSSFASRNGFTYALERATTLGSWTEVGTTNGNGGAVSLADPNPPATRGFYRIRLDRP